MLGRVVTKLKGKADESKDCFSVRRLYTHLVVRLPLGLTPKLCAAMCLPHVEIVTRQWIIDCESANRFVTVEPRHRLSGEHTNEEKGWSCNATESRQAAVERSCLTGHTFYVTKLERPAVAEVKEIIVCAGGSIQEKVPTPESGKVVVISEERESRTWKKLGQMSNVTAVLEVSHLLTCVLRQELDLKSGRLE